MSELLARVVYETTRPVSIALLAGTLGAACLSSAGCGSSPHSEAKGTITCPAGEPVVGVWIDADTGQGWAQWRPQSAEDTTTAEYSRDVGEPTDYSVHVGCGGTPDNWEYADYSPPEQLAPSDITAIWHCGPDPRHSLATNGICHLVGSK